MFYFAKKLASVKGICSILSKSNNKLTPFFKNNLIYAFVIEFLLVSYGSYPGSSCYESRVLDLIRIIYLATIGIGISIYS